VVVALFDHFAAGFNKVISFADAGIVFVFGPKLADPAGPWGFVFAFKVLPVIIFFASLMSVLYYVGIMPRVVAAMAWLLRKTLGISGTEALSAAANVFLGQTEAPLCIRPYLPTMTRSQLCAVMTGGFATIAGSVLAAYVGILGGDTDESRVLFAKHLMTASVMSAVAGLMMAKIILPETEATAAEPPRPVAPDNAPRNILDAAAVGASDGLRLAVNVGAMLIAFVALIALLNWPLAALSELPRVAAWRQSVGLPVLSFENVLGFVFTPIAWSIGVPSADANKVGSLLGTQVIATEFVAYLKLGGFISSDSISPRAAQITTYALCGFANLPSIAIQIGGLSALAPNRRADFASLGFRAVTAGALACWMTGAVASVFI
jgi:CNT family concentrative nucleoside transporter